MLHHTLTNSSTRTHPRVDVHASPRISYIMCAYSGLAMKFREKTEAVWILMSFIRGPIRLPPWPLK